MASKGPDGNIRFHSGRGILVVMAKLRGLIVAVQEYGNAQSALGLPCIMAIQGLFTVLSSVDVTCENSVVASCSKVSGARLSMLAFACRDIRRAGDLMSYFATG